jgi:hypothetical protein
MSFFTNMIRTGQRALGERRRPKRTRPQNGILPCLEILEDRVVLSSYYWVPNPALSPYNQKLVSYASNWRIGGSASDNPRATEAPGADDDLYFAVRGHALLFRADQKGPR